MLTKIANRYIDLTEIVYVSDMNPSGLYFVTFKNGKDINLYDRETTTSLGERIKEVFKQEELIQLINEATKPLVDTTNKMKFIKEGN